MAGKSVVIGCRLPCGIILDLADASGKIVKVELNGQNSAQEGSPIILLSKKDYGITYVDSDFWEAWKKEFSAFPALTSGAIFEAKDERDARAMQKELQDEPTGHEPVAQDSGGVKTEA